MADPFPKAWVALVDDKAYFVTPTTQIEVGDLGDLSGLVAQAQGILDDLDLNYADVVTEAILDARLAPLEYAGITVTAMSVTPATAELGATVNPAVAWTISGSPTVQTLNGVALADQVNDRSKNFTGVTAPNPTQAGSTTYALHVEDGNAPAGVDDDDDRSVTLSWLPRRFWGVSDSTSLNSAAIIALGNSELSNARAKSPTVTTDDDYVFYAYPAYLGDPVSYKIFGFNETPIKTIVTVTTAAGATIDYIVLRSPNKLTGSVPVEVS